MPATVMPTSIDCPADVLTYCEHSAEVREVHAVVVQASAEIVAEAVRSLLEKLRPVTVTRPSDVVTEFSGREKLTRGAAETRESG